MAQSQKKKGGLVTCSIVLKWRTQTNIHVKRIRKCGVPFNYLPLIKHHWLVMEVFNENNIHQGFLATQMIATGDINLFAFSDLKGTDSFGRTGSVIFGEFPTRPCIILEQWTNVHSNHYPFTVDKLCCFMEMYLSFEYHILTNNCVTIAQMVWNFVLHYKQKKHGHCFEEITTKQTHSFSYLTKRKKERVEKEDKKEREESHSNILSGEALSLSKSTSSIE